METLSSQRRRCWNWSLDSVAEVKCPTYFELRCGGWLCMIRAELGSVYTMLHPKYRLPMKEPPISVILLEG